MLGLGINSHYNCFYLSETDCDLFKGGGPRSIHSIISLSMFGLADDIQIELNYHQEI